MKSSLSNRVGAPCSRVKNILVPIDFSAMSIDAIQTAKRLARHFQARVHLAHAQQYSYPAVMIGSGAPMFVAPATDFEKWRKAAEQRLMMLAKEERLTGTCRAEIGGSPFDTLCWIANDIGADLVVTSTHGRTGMKRAFLGSTAERLVQHSPCPVFVDRQRKSRGVRNTIDTILVPVDFSECSLCGLNYAIEFAKALAARILLLHVIDLGPLLTSSDYTRYGRRAFEDAMTLQAHEDMRAFVRRANFRGLPHQSLIVAGGAVERICEVARAENADLIIIATHGRVGLPHLLIGSTAELTVRYAPCPVLAVPSYPEARIGNLRKSQTAKRPTPKPPRKRLLASAATRRGRKLMAQPFPERRRTNKFRETHFGG